jgi:hypothetical protein
MALVPLRPGFESKFYHLLVGKVTEEYFLEPNFPISKKVVIDLQ